MSLLRIKQADGSWSNIPAIKGADGVDGKDGAVQYTAGRYIQIDEDTQTINCTVKIGDLVIIDAVPVKDSTNVVSSGGVYDALETKADKTDIAGLGSEAGFITSSVEDLKNYYKKSETYSQEEVNSLIGNLTRLTLQVVSELPEVGTEQIIYLVPNNESGNNIYEEWIFVQSKWEIIGTTEVDLSNYYTKEEIDNLLSQNSESEIVIYTGVSLSFGNQSEYSAKIGTIPADKRTEITNIVNSYYIGGGNFTKPIAFDFNGVRLKPIYRGQGIASGGKTTINFQLELTASSYTDPHKYDLATIELSFCFNGSQGSFTPNYSSSLSYWGVRAYFINYLSKSNTYAYTPSSDYHPATKKYVDEAVANASAGGGDDIDLSNVLTKDNTEEFTPDGDYEPATKKYVDDAVANAGGDSANTAIYFYDLNLPGFQFTDYTFIEKTSDQTTRFYELLNKIISDGNENNFVIVVSNAVATVKKYVLTLDPDSNKLTQGGSIKLSGTQFWNSSKGLLKYYVCTISGTSSITDGVLSPSGSHTIWTTMSNLIPTDNTTLYTPSNDYNPATKKYVDDAVANVSGGSGGESEGQTDQVFKIFSNDVTIGYDNSNADICAQLGEILGKVYAIRNNYTAGAQIIWIDAKDFLNVVFRSKPGSFGIFYGLCYLPKVSDTVEETLELKPTYTSKDVDGVKVFNVTKFRISKITVKRTATDPTESYQVATKNYVDNAVANAGGETPDLTAYAKLTDVLTKTNTTEYTPASAYHPATKQYVDQAVAGAGGITEESDPTVPLHVKNITQDMISKWNTVEDKLTKEELSTSASEAGLITIDSINYPIVVKGRYNVDVVKYSDNETVTPQILDYTIDESAMPFINAALKRFLKIKQDIGQSLIYTDSSFGDYTMVYMPLDISLLVELLQDATIEYNDYDDSNNSYTKTTAINSDDIKAFTPSIANNFDGHRAVLSVTHYFNEQYQSFDDIKITFKEIYSDYNRKDISLRISSKINYNSEYDFELHTLSLSQNTALHIDKGTGTVIPTSTNDLNNNSGFITSDDLPEQLVIEGVIDDTYGKGNRILNPGKGSYSYINKPNENAFAIGEFSTSAGFNTVAYGSGALAEGYNINSRIICSSGQGSGKEFTFKGVGNSSHIRVGSKIYNDKLKKAFTVTEVTEYEAGEITYRNIKIKRDSQDEDVFSGNNYIINAGSIATHSEGMECQALGNCSHAEGSRAVATGYCSHAQNDAATAAGNYSHAGGVWSEANGSCSIAHGRTLTNNVDYSALFGKYATLDAETDADVVFAIGNGNSYDDQNIGLKLVGAKGEGKLYVENTLIGADPSTYAGFDNTKTQVLKHINGVFTWVDE